MDRSFLSDKAVIEASRSFVCARLMTYECAEEEKLLESIFLGRSGDLENTTFTILAPDGVTRLARAGRSPSFAYGRDGGAAARMAEDMRRIAKRYPGARRASTSAPLPLVEDVRLGVNVAACDARPLVVVVGKDKAQRAALEARLAPVAWSDAMIGRFLYASTQDAQKDLKPLAKAKAEPGFLIVAPSTYGQAGAALVQLPADATDTTLRAALQRALAKHDGAAKDYRSHVRKGRRDGVHWETEIPVTDPGKPPPGRHGPPR